MHVNKLAQAQHQVFNNEFEHRITKENNSTVHCDVIIKIFQRKFEIVD